MNATQKHLKQLTDLNIILKEKQNGTTFYAPDPLYTRMQAVRDLINKHDSDELIQMRKELQTLSEENTSEDELLQYRIGLVKEAISTRRTESY
jgi:hypothetical protein